VGDTNVAYSRITKSRPGHWPAPRRRKLTGAPSWQAARGWSHPRVALRPPTAPQSTLSVGTVAAVGQGASAASSSLICDALGRTAHLLAPFRSTHGGRTWPPTVSISLLARSLSSTTSPRLPASTTRKRRCACSNA